MKPITFACIWFYVGLKKFERQSFVILRILKSCTVRRKFEQSRASVRATTFNGCRSITPIHRIYHPSLNLQRAFRIQLWHSLIYSRTRQMRLHGSALIYYIFANCLPRNLMKLAIFMDQSRVIFCHAYFFIIKPWSCNALRN